MFVVWQYGTNMTMIKVSERIGRLSERERLNLLRTFDEVVPRIPERAARQVDQELKAIRLARRSGGRGALTKRKP